MGAKKKAEGKKKGGDDDGDSPADMHEALAAQVESLRQKLVLEQEKKDKSYNNEVNCQINLKCLLETEQEHKASTKECVTDMTDQYKRMEQHLQKKIASLTGEVEEQERSMACMKEELNQKNS